jgi:dTDP-4-amino-4,6-dideoxygalactose transaminase
MSATPSIRIPLMNLKLQTQSMRDDILSAFKEILDNTSFCLGPEVEAFEREFAAYCGTTYGVGMNSGTSALHAALSALGVGPGDEVVTTPFTFVATAWAISYCGAKPVFADILPDTFTLDPDCVAAAITPRTKAILPVHLYGQPCDLEPLLDIAKRKGLPLVEDAAQAHGARWKDRPVGSWGQIGCFSFYPGKNLGACGEGGIAVTSDRALAEKMRLLRCHGEVQRYHSALIGHNWRMEGLQGAVLRKKLSRLDAWNARRRALAARYDSILCEAGVRTPALGANRTHVYHLYVIRHPRRDALSDYLLERGIGTGKHYPLPLHRQEAYAHLNLPHGAFPQAEAAAEEVLCLPMFPELTDAQADEVAASVLNWRERK